MILNHKLGHPFGNVGVLSGIVLILFGLLSLFNAVSFLLLIVGSFFAFTCSGTQINTQTRKFRLYQNLFGIIKAGKWQSLDLYAGLAIVPLTRITVMRSISNRGNTSETNEFRIFLVNSNHKPEVPLKKIKTQDEAQQKLDELAFLLQLPVFSVGKIKSNS